MPLAPSGRRESRTRRSVSQDCCARIRRWEALRRRRARPYCLSLTTAPSFPALRLEYHLSAWRAGASLVRARKVYCLQPLEAERYLKNAIFSSRFLVICLLYSPLIFLTYSNPDIISALHPRSQSNPRPPIHSFPCPHPIQVQPPFPSSVPPSHSPP